MIQESQHIKGLHHIAIICSSEISVSFYEKLGFKVTSRIDRGYDILVFMSGYGLTLELFVDDKHPQRVDRPEALGLRHLALKVDDVEKTIAELEIDTEPIRESDGKRFTFFKDPDGLPIELHE